jgi:geranylgeranyl diphosphate synthase type I
MDAMRALKDFKSRLDAELEGYFKKIIRDAREKDVFTAEVLEHAKKLTLAGGKRLRPALMYYGYKGAGGVLEDEIVRASMSIELIHSFLLIHDDIIDRDGLRHGVETLHRRYGRLGEVLFPGSESDHFGNSIALIAGDMVGALGNQVLFESRFDPKLVLKALSRLQSVVALTVVGQAKDVYIEYAKQATEEEVLRMYEYKTARYTVEGPLHLGAVLAGAEDGMLATFSRYAIPLGIAFQIQDDILGVFGTEKKIGKTVGSDIQEGKFTLLVCRAFQNLGSGASELEALLRKGKALVPGDIVRFRDILTETGSLEHARALSARYISEGKSAILESRDIRPEARDFLLGIADYMARREC